ncbi:VanZ family protein [Actinoplanes sp. NEAU-A12]|uniref:VanZ family protein n=1 Tax=Actinoplanes sandaracinus TaxID=3045177 RepID=A0ABT6WC61_9ACTN|nr:VanZ family protein [Actinoplanes sandaracinus]MDI6097319.1 VanZ family protein [Actinoplanes sandaracinus]
MPTHQIDIPALPVLLPLGVALMIFTGLFLRRRGLLTAGRLLLGWFAGWYAVAVLGATLLPMHMAWGGDYDPDHYRFMFIPLLEMRPLDFALNTIMTLPLAGLLYLLFGMREERRLVRTGFLISLAIETIQLVMLFTVDGNRWADVNDLMSNTLGTWLGCLGFRRLMRSAHFRRAVESCSFVRTVRTARDTSAAAR